MSGEAELGFTALPGVEFKRDDRGCLIVDDTHLDISGRVTNDVVDLRSPLEFIWKGRYDNVINTGGVKVHPESLEEVLSSQLGVEVMVAAVPDTQLGEKIIAIAEDDIEIQDIEKQIDRIYDLHAYEKPRNWFTLERFERNEAGKLDRLATLKKLEL